MVCCGVLKSCASCFSVGFFHKDTRARRRRVWRDKNVWLLAVSCPWRTRFFPWKPVRLSLHRVKINSKSSLVNPVFSLRTMSLEDHSDQGFSSNLEWGYKRFDLFHEREEPQSPCVSESFWILNRHNARTSPGVERSFCRGLSVGFPCSDNAPSACIDCISSFAKK